ncbi:MAG: type VI secretion protein IcmF/TssM N-terminal domain-containing protein [Phycisphaerales bacterium]
MIAVVERFVQLPPAAKAGVALASGAGILASVALLLSAQAAYTLAAGLALLAALLLGYRALLKWHGKRKAAPMTQALAGNAGSAPMGIADPARRAALDGMRKSFETGVEKFRSAGKNLYALPWYALVGEAGSGKTEAIRHCNVGFPPGLQDQLQGVGGTINMNWWFTNHAVILDTAGRLMFEEVEPGSTNEWQEFLKLLRRHRPNCPINGMLLVIPAESLIRDTSDEIERKAGKIAAQLDNIQRTLGVRFPVFVIVTKSDLINGFRDFFDTIKDPTLQHQIVGWSNPADLDTPFSPEAVEQHLKTVQNRLQRRRLGLLLDPVNTEDANARRTDQVDALYAFPDALMKIAPRLRRYLEMIFVAGEWSSKPLFLRGIYFTSSMREGSALDADLAEALGRPVEGLPEGRLWERDRAFFLRELFLSKIFKEKGLVTRAGNTRQQQRRRRSVVFGSAAAALAVVAGFTAFGWIDLQSAVSRPVTFWSQVQAAFADPERLEAPSVLLNRNPDGPVYRPPNYVSSEGESNPAELRLRGISAIRGPHRYGEFAKVLADEAANPIKVPFIFRLVAFVTRDDTGNLLASKRGEAARVLLEEVVLRPGLEETRKRLRAELGRPAEGAPRAPGAFASSLAQEAYHQLARVELAALEGNTAPAAIDPHPILLYPLGSSDELAADRADAEEDATGFRDAVSRLYAPANGDRAWGRRLASRDPELAVRGARSLAAEWAAPTGGELGPARGLLDELEAFDAAEKQVHDGMKSRAAFDDASGAWATPYAALSARVAPIGSRVQELALAPGKGLTEAYAEAIVRWRQRVVDPLVNDLSRLEPGEGGRAAAIGEGSTATDKERRTILVQALAALKPYAGESDADRARAEKLKTLDELHLGPTRDRYGKRADAYAQVEALRALAGAAADTPLGRFKLALDDVDSRLTATGAKLAKPADLPAAAATRWDAATAASNTMVNLAARERRRRLAASFVDLAPRTAETWESAVRSVAALPESGVVEADPVPLTQMEQRAVAGKFRFDERYHPAAAAALLGDVARVDAVRKDPAVGAPDAESAWRSILAADRTYASAYMDHWTSGRLSDLGLRTDLKWAEFSKAMARHPQVEDYLFRLDGLLDQIAKAVEAVQQHLSDPAVKPSEVLANIAAAKTALAQGQRSGKFQSVLGRWLGLDGDDVGKAREQLRKSVKDEEFLVRYVPAAVEPGAELRDAASWFWENFALSALTLAADESEARNKSEVDDLRRRAAFPLDTGAGPEMSPADVANAGRLVADILPATTGGDWTRTRREKFDKQIARLFGAGFSQHAEWLGRVRSLVAALPPREGETLACKVWIAKPPRDYPVERTVADPMPYLDVYQGETRVGGESLRSVQDRLPAELPEAGDWQFAYPRDGVRFDFYANPVDDSKREGKKPLQVVRMPGSWGALRLLHGTPEAPCVAEKLDAEGRRWRVEVRAANPRPDAPPEQARLSLWLEVEFTAPMPALDRWPKK